MNPLKDYPGISLSIITLLISAVLFYNVRPIGGVLVLVFGSIGSLILMIGIPVVQTIVDKVVSWFSGGK